MVITRPGAQRATSSTGQASPPTNNRNGEPDLYELNVKTGFLKDLTQKNVYRQTDYLAFLVTLKQEGLLLRQLEIQFRNDHGTLNYLCGIVDTAATRLAAPEIELQSLPAVTNSVFFHQFHLDSLKLRNDRSLVDFSYKPKANLYADGGYSSSLASMRA